MPGAIPVMYCKANGLSKRNQQAIVHPFILIMQLVAPALLGMQVTWMLRWRRMWLCRCRH
jgi:hypothetical protein